MELQAVSADITSSEFGVEIIKEFGFNSNLANKEPHSKIIFQPSVLVILESIHLATFFL